ncbi:MAG: TIGR04282 family arsenosugar biosynthesis glycosyltransferase [Betaproteobacteria bacterium]
MPPTASDTRLIVFARTPQPGAVKTRLIPLLGAEGAAALHVRLLERTLATARAADIGPVELHCTPDCEHAYIRECAARYRVSLIRQVEGDLGARMARALNRALQRSRNALVIGTDCAVLTAQHLQEARQALHEGVDAVIVPAEDGGYALIGLNRCDPRIFAGIAWGGAEVLNQTRARLSELGWQWRELETLWDVDRPEDYRRLLASRLIDPVSGHDSPA